MHHTDIKIQREKHITVIVINHIYITVILLHNYIMVFQTGICEDFFFFIKKTINKEIKINNLL